MPPTGRDEQRDPPRRRIEPAGISVTVGFDGRSERWRLVTDLAEAGPQDAVYVLDPETGQVMFGDGEHGRRPLAEAIVQVRYGAGPGTQGNLTGQGPLIDGYDYGLQLTPTVPTPPGKIRQIMPADGWYAVELRRAGERLIPLVGWALLAPYSPPYRNGSEPPLVTTESVRGLIAPGGGPVRIVDELSALFGGYRQA